MTFFAPLTGHRSRKLIQPFRLHRATSVGEAAAMKEGAGPGAVFMAGGIDLVNRMKFGMPVSDVVYLGGVAGLDKIDVDGSALRLGSLTTHDQLANSPVVRECLPMLAQTWSGIANIRIRRKGTIGGNIMAGDPAYDFALAAAAAGARLEFLRADGSSSPITVNGAADGENGLLVAIIFPRAASSRLIFARSLRPIVTLTIGLDLDGDRIVAARLAIGCAYRRIIFVALPLAEPVSARQLAAEAAEFAQSVVAGLPEPLDDHNASAAYRRRVIGVLLRRQLGALA